MNSKRPSSIANRRVHNLSKAATGGIRVEDDRATAESLGTELADLRAEVGRLRAENTRLLRLLDLTSAQARPPEPAQSAIFESAPGGVNAGSSPAAKVASYAALFVARLDAYAVRWDNARLGKGG